MAVFQHGDRNDRWVGKKCAADVEDKDLADDSDDLVSFKLAVGLTKEGPATPAQLTELRELVPLLAADQTTDMLIAALCEWRYRQRFAADRHNHETVTVSVPGLDIGVWVTMQVTYRAVVGTIPNPVFDENLRDLCQQAVGQAVKQTLGLLNQWAEQPAAQTVVFLAVVGVVPM